MANMSYCRFENTAHDLRDCLEVLNAIRIDIPKPLNDLSYSEIQGLKDIIDYSQEIVNMRENIEKEIQTLKEI